MDKKIIAGPDAPAAVGPYSQAVRAGDLLFISGQIGLDPATGALRPGGFAEEAGQVLKNLGAILAAEGLDFSHLIKTTVYVTDLTKFPVLNQLYGEVVGQTPPARATIQVVALPLGAQVEIEAVAWAG